MHLETFEKLFRIIKPCLYEVLGHNVKRTHSPNGLIPLESRLACVIRLFAGGSPYDLITVYKISYTEILNSLWYIVDAVNKCESLALKLPQTHDEQKAIAKGFQVLSAANIDKCVGVVDGMMVTMAKPKEKHVEMAGIGSQKCYCTRKKRYGLNLQAVCDHKKDLQTSP